MQGEMHTDSETDAALVAQPEPQTASRVKRVGGAVVATALLVAGAVAIYGRNSGVRFVNEDKVTQEYEETVVVPPSKMCSKTTEDCSSTKCCKTTGYKCFMKDAGKAKCMTECEPGKDGWCTELVTLKPVKSYPGLRFFCFTFYTEDTGSTKPNYELSLIRTQLTLGAGIFGCPKWAVYSDAATWLSPGPPALNTIQVKDVDGDFHLFKRKGKDTWTNAMMFYQAWKDIRDTGKTAGSDWVIKTDIDAVFLPERLLHRMQGFHVPEGGVFIENCEKVMYGFFGNLEVVSKDGFDKFASNLESCKKTVDWKGTDPKWKFGPYGEDLFMQMCMEKVGVQKQSDFYMDADGACPAKRPKALRKSPKTWHPSCEGNQAIVIHPLKKPEEYFTCLAVTQGLDPKR